MADPLKPSTIKSLDGTLQTIANGVSKPTQPQADVSLPSRLLKQTSASSKDSVPPPGATLTGKQEHCM